MNTLILYMVITTDPMPLPPKRIRQLQDGDVRVLDMDQDSGNEVIHVATEAIERAAQVILALDIRQERPLNKLFPLLKKISANAAKVRWYQSGEQKEVEIFRKNVAVLKFGSAEELADRLENELNKK